MNPFAHVIHILLTILFFPWGLVYLCCLVSAGNKRRREEAAMKKEQLELLRQLVKEKK